VSSPQAGHLYPFAIVSRPLPAEFSKARLKLARCDIQSQRAGGSAGNCGGLDWSRRRLFQALYRVAESCRLKKRIDVTNHPFFEQLARFVKRVTSNLTGIEPSV
jgi:hypothetical protein